MCIIMVMYQTVPDYPIVIAANRDEYYSRSALGPNVLQHHPTSWGGRDQQAGGDLLSHTATRAVPSAQRALTSVFGMGTGVTPSLWSPKPSCMRLVHDTLAYDWTCISSLVKVKSHDRLVRLSFTRHRASTCRLSTLSSSTGLWDVSIRECSS